MLQDSGLPFCLETIIEVDFFYRNALINENIAKLQFLITQLAVLAHDRQSPSGLFSTSSSSTMSEMDALQQCQTRELVKLPPGKHTIGCHWVFTVKHRGDGSIVHYKATLVAKGFTQKHGADYGQTFAPVEKLNFIRLLISLASRYNCPLHQMDVMNAFLHGELAEEIYMTPPLGFLLQGGHSCKV